MHQPNKKTANSLIAYDAIKQMIVSKDLLPGEQIVEGTLAQMLNMSRTPVREAMRKIQQEGLIETIPNKGSFIKRFTKQDVVMAYELISATAGMCAYLLAEQIEKGEIEKSFLSELVDCIYNMDTHTQCENPKLWADEDEKFHLILCEKCGNTIILETYKQYKWKINQVLWFVVTGNFDRELSNQNHKDMLLAIKNGEKEKAQQIAQWHRIRIVNTLKQQI